MRAGTLADASQPITQYTKSRQTRTMVRVEQHSGAQDMHLVDLPAGDPGLGDLRIRHPACGLNVIGVLQPEHRFLTLPVWCFTLCST